MSNVKTSLTENAATVTPFAPTVDIPASDVQTAIEHVMASVPVDGDKGDITVSGGGSVLTIDNDAVTYAKIQNVSATDKILGRSTAGAGDIEEIACTAAGRALLDDADALAQRTTLGLGTTDVPQFSGVNIGNASDTTIGRISAGNIAVEGNYLYRAGGTDVPLADGGTGASLSAPGADRILFHDHSAGAVTWLEVGSGLSIAGTVLSASAATPYTPGPQGRLSLSNGVAVADVTAASTLYYVPYTGSLVPVYDGAALTMIDIGAGLSLAPSLFNNTNYDVFAYSNAGTPTLFRGPAWSSATSRGTGAGTTELERIEGLWVNKYNLSGGPNAQRGTYLGTIRADATPDMNDNVTDRHVWNMYNRVLRAFLLKITTDYWTYSTASWRQVQGSSTYQVSMVRGIDEDLVNARYSVVFNTSTATSRAATVGIGLDNTTQPNDIYASGNASSGQWSGFPYAEYNSLPGLGYHYLAMLERGAGADTQTWYGDAGDPNNLQFGLTGRVYA